MALHGIDVSAWQPGNVTRTVSADFAIIKATEGTGYVSSQLGAQIAGAVATGKLYGLYHFASGGDANAEANHFAQTVREHVGKAILVLDFEAGALARGAGWALAFLNRVHAVTGVKPLLYVQGSQASQAQYRQVANAGYGLWIAAWGTNPTGGFENAPASSSAGVWPFAALRQFASNGTLAGYGGRLDLNVFYGDAEAWAAYASSTGASVPQPPAGSVSTAPIVGWNASTRSTSDIQSLVGAAVDNVYGPETTEKVAAWQTAHGLVPDGVFGPKSEAVAWPKTAPKQGVPAPAFPLPKGWYFGPESGPKQSVSGFHGRGKGLETWQQRMHERGWKITPDGLYGEQTARIAHAFQVEKNLTVDSLIGPQTWSAAWTEPVT